MSITYAVECKFKGGKVSWFRNFNRSNINSLCESLNQYKSDYPDIIILGVYIIENGIMKNEKRLLLPEEYMIQKFYTTYEERLLATHEYLSLTNGKQRGA